MALRSVFELSCNSFFYYDHPIEFYMFQNENMKADKYVSVLVSEYNFFKTKYIRAFCKKIDQIQKEEDSLAKYLQKLYGELSDVLHGRYNKLEKIGDFSVSYEISKYKKFEDLYLKTVSAIIVMAVLRFDINIDEKEKYFKITGVMKDE